MRTRFFTLLVSMLLLSWLPFMEGGIRDAEGGGPGIRVPILLYHRFGPFLADSMTVTTSAFESQLKDLRDHGYTVISLKQLVEYYYRKGPSLPERPVVITVDDGHKSVYTDMLPLLKKYRFPATLFLYPSALSNASYAMTWEELQEMKETGLFDLQAHTFWHPNFKTEKRRLKPVEYESFVEMQLKKSKEKLEKEFHTQVNILAWPFGIYDDELVRKATETGYVAGLSMDRRCASPSDHIMTLPRYLVGNADHLSRYKL